MSYFGNNNNPLAFPSYNQSPFPQRSLSGMGNIQQQQLSHLQNPQGHQADSASAAAMAVAQQQQQHQHQQQQQQQQQHRQHSLQHVHKLQGPGSSTPQHGQTQTDEKQGQAAIRKERKNRPGQKFGAKKKSWVWSWFIQDSQDPNIAACDYCGKIITRLASDKGSPKKLSEHLKTHKLTKDSINNSRPIPIDGNGITYAPNGMPLNYPSNFQQSQQVQPSQPSASPVGSVNPQLSDDGDELDPKKKVKYNKYKPRNNMNGIDSSLSSFGVNSNRRFLSADFDNSPYSSMKFHKHLMKFLTENKLSINVIKSHSFQQLIYDLRSDSVTELLELTGLYSSLLEVSRFDGNGAGSNADNHDSSSIPSVNEANVVNSLAQAVEQKANNANAIGVVNTTSNQG